MKFVVAFEDVLNNTIVYECFLKESIEEARRYCNQVVAVKTNYSKDYDLYISGFDHVKEMNKQLNEVYKEYYFGARDL